MWGTLTVRLEVNIPSITKGELARTRRVVIANIPCEDAEAQNEYEKFKQFNSELAAGNLSAEFTAKLLIV